MAFARHGSIVLLLAALLGLAGCSNSTFETPQMQGPAAMVADGDQSRLWVLSKQEEKHMVSVGSGRRSAMSWRTDTFFHFAVEAIDPVSTKPLWKRRLVTYGDPKAQGPLPSRVIGSSVSANFLGQDGEVVWLLVGDVPYGVSAKDGRVVVDADKLQALNPELKGLLPSEARHYGFDRGLVLMSADARRFVVRGPGHKAVGYTPPPPPAEKEGPLLANGRRELVPMRPLGESPTRQATLGGQWLGLYSEKEAANILGDEWGRTLRWPYVVLDEGSLARRSFWRGRTEVVRRFDDRYERLAALTPVEGAPTFLKGRFFKDTRAGQALQLSEPAGMLVWHSTRMDSAGRLALARVDASLKTLWKSELPLSETDTVRRVATWQLPGHIIVVGMLQTQDDGGVTHRDPYLVSIDVANGSVRSRKLTEVEKD